MATEPINVTAVDMNRLDQIEKRIFAALQKDGRSSVQDLSAQVGLSPSRCHRGVRQLERDGFISRYVAIVDPAKLGATIDAFARVSLERQDAGMLREFEAAIAPWPEVLERYLMTGESDYPLRILTAGIADYEAFIRERLSEAPGVAKIESSIAFRPVVSQPSCRSASVAATPSLFGDDHGFT